MLRVPFCLVSIHAPLARSNPEEKGRSLFVCVSIHAPLARSNNCLFIRLWHIFRFQYMLLLRGATRRASTSSGRRGFNTCSSCEEQRNELLFVSAFLEVSIHAPLARSNAKKITAEVLAAFQYMLLLRGATLRFGVSTVRLLFQYMLLLRGATPLQQFLVTHCSFQYMLLLRGATSTCPSVASSPKVSIHAPLARSNKTPNRGRSGVTVSIHAPLARSNRKSNSRLPVFASVSIHAPLARSNDIGNRNQNVRQRFNTCSSCEEQHNLELSGFSTLCFNTCSSCEEQLLGNFRTRLIKLFQYMLLLRGATTFAQNVGQSTVFQYMLLLRGATGVI